MSIDGVCGLLAMSHVYYELMPVNILGRKRTSAGESRRSRDVIHLDRFFRWIEGQM